MYEAEIVPTNVFVPQKQTKLCTRKCSLGHCELIINHIDSNGDPQSLTVYHASHNVCGASCYDLMSSHYVDKGPKN